MSDQAKPAHGPATPPLPILPRFDASLSGRATKIYWSLTEWAWGRKPYCYPSVQTIADTVGCSRRTVSLAIKELEEAGRIKTHYNRSNVGRYRVIVILDRVPVPVLKMVDPQTDPRLDQSDDCQRGRAKQGGGRAKNDATPAQDFARPIAQNLAPKELSEKLQSKEKKNLEAATSPKEGGSPPPGGKADEDPWEPQYLRDAVQMTAADVLYWREILNTQEFHPLKKTARTLLDRYEQHKANLPKPEASCPAVKAEPARQAVQAIEEAEPAQEVSQAVQKARPASLPEPETSCPAVEAGPVSPPAQEAKKTGQSTWRRLDQLTPEDVARFRQIAADPAEPLASVYQAVLRRYDRQFPGMRAKTEGKAGSGPPTKESPDPAPRDKNPVRDDFTKIDASGQSE